MLFGPFYDVILPIDHVFLDGITSFLRVINVRKTCKPLRFFSTIEENRKNLEYTTAFASFLVC